MNSCDKFTDLLVLYSEGALDAKQEREIQEHLKTCDGCRQEMEAIGTVRGWLSDPELFAPTQDYAWQKMPGMLAAKARTVGETRRWLPLNFGSPGWVLSAAAATVLCFGLVWMTHRHPPEAPVATASVAPGNAAFLGRMQTAYAREATAQYLSDCEDLLLSVMRAEKHCQGELYDVSTEVLQARQLLQRKQLLEAELQSPQVMQAKGLCDELERFLVDISTSGKCESRDRIHRMERYIQREKLLLRINVLQSELS